MVGEVRGAEVRDLLAAMNTGHEGGCATVHANSAADVPARLEALAALGQMGRQALHAQLISAVDLVIHVGRRSGQRRLEEIHIVVGAAGTGLARTECAVEFSADGRIRHGPGALQLERLLSR